MRKVVTDPADLETSSKWIALKWSRLARGYLKIIQIMTAVRGWSHSERLFSTSAAPCKQRRSLTAPREWQLVTDCQTTPPHTEMNCPSALIQWAAAKAVPWDAVKALSGIPAANEPEQQSTHSCRVQKYTPTVLPPRYLQRHTICHGLVTQHLEDANTFPHCKSLCWGDDLIHFTAKEVGEAPINVTEAM